jgi:hypothetical protein
MLKKYIPYIPIYYILVHEANNYLNYIAVDAEYHVDIS